MWVFVLLGERKMIDSGRNAVWEECSTDGAQNATAMFQISWMGQAVGLMKIPKAPCRYIRYILRAQRGSHIPILRPEYIPYSYMGPLGRGL